jgi:hypothetical protein
MLLRRFGCGESLHPGRLKALSTPFDAPRRRALSLSASPRCGVKRSTSTSGCIGGGLAALTG